METEEFYQPGNNINLQFASQTETPMSEDEKWLIALGGMFSSLSVDYVNVIDTGRSNKDIRETLRKRWLIDSDRAVFEGAALRLVMGEKRKLHMRRFDMIKRFFKFFDNSNILVKTLSKFSLLFSLDWYQTRTKEDLRAIARKELDLDRMAKNGSKKNEELFKLLKDAVHWCKEIEKIGDYRQINDLVAWDAVCLVNLTRYVTQVNLIDRSEFVRYAGAIKKQVQIAYNSWDEVALAYLIGTFLWNYSEQKSKTVIKALRTYLDDKRTLVHAVNFK